MSITGARDGEPTKVGVAIIDIVAGLMLGQSIVAALFARERLGTGQKIETSLLETEVACLINAGSNYLLGGSIPGRWGNAHPNIVPYQSFKTRDGYLVVGVASEGIWHRFCQAIGKPEFADDPRFAKNAQRVQNREELIRLLTEIFLGQDTATWTKALSSGDIPSAPVQTIDQVFSDPQVLHRQMLVEMEHPKAGTFRMSGLPVKLSTTPATIRIPPPLLGEHTEEVLRAWLKMEGGEINGLRDEGVI
jgi:crotonobetainyl-CoA:carnitine CoA-transferase CaiB-like acyl-CoA transferase